MNTKKLKPGMLLAIKEEKKSKYFLTNSINIHAKTSTHGIRSLSLISTKYTLFKPESGDRWLDDELFLYLGKTNFSVNLPVVGEVLAAYHQVLWNGEIYEIINHNFFYNMKIV